MSLPDTLEIVPLTRPVKAEVSVPGSKSITNRALVLAALGPGETVLRGALWSEDTQVMVECLQELGFMIQLQPDPAESCNRTITVYGKDGQIPAGGTESQPLDLFVGNAGTAARFLTALLCLGNGVYRLHGVPRMHERPQASLFRAMRDLGYRLDSPEDHLPVTIHGGGPRSASAQVAIGQSSQFASALLLCAPSAGWKITVTGENAEESPYVAMTSRLVETFPRQGGTLLIEPDASSGSYFHAANWLLMTGSATADSRITVGNWPASGWQVDEKFTRFVIPGQRALPPVISRQNDLGDSIMGAIVLAPLAAKTVSFTDLGRLRLQECERVKSLRTELSKCGAQVFEEGESLRVVPSDLHGAEVETYNDHRMAMCFGILGLKIPGLRIKNPGCVKKTFPDFFQKLAAPPPQGLGAVILEAETKRMLEPNELF